MQSSAENPLCTNRFCSVAADIFLGQSRPHGPGPPDCEPGLAGCLLAMQRLGWPGHRFQQSCHPHRAVGLLSFGMPGLILILIWFLLAFAHFHLTRHISANMCSVLLRGNCKKNRCVLKGCLSEFLLQFLWAGFYVQQHWGSPGGGFRWAVSHFS